MIWLVLKMIGKSHTHTHKHTHRFEVDGEQIKCRKKYPGMGNRMKKDMEAEKSGQDLILARM